MTDPVTAIALNTRMLAAATMTAGVVSNYPDDLARDPEVNDQTKAENLTAWRIFVIFDKALAAYAEANSTPLPKIEDAGSFVQRLLPALTPLIGSIPGIGNVANLIEAGIGVLNAVKPTAAAPQLSGPIPAPGP